MARTAVDLSTEALKELRILAADETASAADQTQMLDEYSDLLLELEIAGIAAWDEDAIPNAYFRPLSMVLAARAQRKFGVTYEVDEITAKSLLRAVVAKPYLGQPATPDYY